MSKPAPDYRTDLLARKNIYDRIMRVWSAHLDSYELHVVMVLAATGMSFGYEVIEMSHEGMVTGVPKKDNPKEWFIPRMNMSDKTLRRSIKSLKEKGIVNYTFTGRANRYEVNWNWEPAMGVPTPKRLKNVETGCKTEQQEDAGWSDRPGRVVSQTTQGGPTDLLYTRGVNKTSNKRYSSAGAPHVATPKKTENLPAGSGEVKKVLPDNAAARMAAHSDKMAAERQKRLAKARSKDHSGAFEETWKAAWREAFPSDPCIGWSPKERGQINHARQRFTKSVEEFHALIDFTVRNWSVLRGTALKWMKALEPVPQAQAFLSGLADLASAHVEHRAAAGRSQFSKTEEETIEELQRYGGKTYEQAIAAVGEQRGRALERRETGKIRTRAEREMQMAHEQRQQAAALAAAAARQPAAPAEPVIVHEADVDPALDAQTEQVFAGMAGVKDDGFVWK